MSELIINYLKSVIIGDFFIHDMPSYQDQTWIRLWKENAPELRSRVIGWRKQNAITRIDRPSRLERARRLGYKAKQGIVVVRMRVGTGGMRKQRPTGGRRPKHLGVTRIKADDNMKTVAERRVLERYPNMKLLGSYYIYKDGKHYWFEVILADPSHPRIAQDKELNRRVPQSA
jgi:large subunit ribosomal protein L15e